MAEKRDLSDQAVDAAKELAPWSTRIPWWVVLIEGIIVAGIGLLTVLDPQAANVNLALFMCVGLVFAGLMQMWSVLRSRVPDTIDSIVSARAAIAIFAGLSILILYFIEGALTRVAGFGIFGTAALLYGLLALVQVVRTDGSSRRRALVEFILFTAVGVLTLWGLYAGGEAIVSAVNIIGWIFLAGGIVLIGLAIWRWQKGDEADEMIDSVTTSVSSAGEKVTSLGKSDSAEAAIPAAKEVVDEAQDKTT